MSLLLPDGVSHLLDLPQTHFDAIRNALTFLSFDELLKEEQPPRSIWYDGKALREHFKAVDARRRAKFGLESEGNLSDEPIEGPVERNDLEGILGIKRR